MPMTFAELVAEVEQLAGNKGRAQPAPSREGELEGVLLFDTQPDAGLDLVVRHQARLRGAGAYLFLYEHGFGHGPDVIGLAPTVDKFDLIRRAQTDGLNYDHDTADVIAWLREMDRDDPLEVLGAGADFVEGYFRGPIQDAGRLAERIYSFCPDFVDQGLGLAEEGEPHELIVRYFAASRDFFFWWD
jgi:hypothetical protein